LGNDRRESLTKTKPVPVLNPPGEEKNPISSFSYFDPFHIIPNYTLSEAWSGMNWADLMAARAPSGPIFMTGLPER